VFAEHDELVAAESGDGVTEPECFAQAASDVGEETVPGVVTEAVIDKFETIEVEEQHREGPATARGSGDGPFRDLAEQCPVREPRQEVVGRVVLQSCLHGLELGDVVRDGRDPHDVPRVVVVGLDCRRDGHRAGGSDELQFARPDAPAVHDRHDLDAEPVPRPRGGELAHGSTLGGAEQGAGRLVGVDDLTAGSETTTTSLLASRISVSSAALCSAPADR